MDKRAETLLLASKLSKQINSILGLISGIVLCLLTLIILVDVSGRYALNSPLQGALEMAEAALVFLIFFAITYCQVEGKHMKETLVLERLPRRWQTVCETAALIGGIALMSLITWQNFLYVVESYVIDETRITFPLPLYPMKFAVFLGCSLFTIQLIIEICILLMGKQKTAEGSK